jgi:hypothetical protein
VVPVPQGDVALEGGERFGAPPEQREHPGQVVERDGALRGRARRLGAGVERAIRRPGLDERVAEIGQDAGRAGSSVAPEVAARSARALS